MRLIPDGTMEASLLVLCFGILVAQGVDESPLIAKYMANLAALRVEADFQVAESEDRGQVPARPAVWTRTDRAFLGRRVTPSITGAFGSDGVHTSVYNRSVEDMASARKRLDASKTNELTDYVPPTELLTNQSRTLLCTDGWLRVWSDEDSSVVTHPLAVPGVGVFKPQWVAKKRKQGFAVSEGEAEIDGVRCASLSLRSTGIEPEMRFDFFFVIDLGVAPRFIRNAIAAPDGLKVTETYCLSSHRCKAGGVFPTHLVTRKFVAPGAAMGTVDADPSAVLRAKLGGTVTEHLVGKVEDLEGAMQAKLQPKVLLVERGLVRLDKSLKDSRRVDHLFSLVEGLITKPRISKR